MITLDEFVSKYTGKGIDYDGHYGFQCQDLYRQYVKECLGFPQSPGVPGAKDNWDAYLPEYYDRIQNTPEGVPEKGDIMLWGTAYGPYGHVAVVISATASTITCFSQNDPTGSLCVIKKYSSYKGVIGWLHPKTPSTSYRGYDLTNLDSMKVCVDDHVRVVEGQLVDKSQYESIKGQLTESQKRVEELGSELGVIRGELTAAIQKNDNQNQVISSYVNEDAVQLETLKRLERERGAILDDYLDLLNPTAEELKVSIGSESRQDSNTKVLGALRGQIQMSASLQSKVLDLEKEIKRLNTHKMPIDKLSIKQVIILLIEKLKGYYGKK